MKTIDISLPLDMEKCRTAAEQCLILNQIHMSLQSFNELIKFISVSEYRRQKGCFVTFNEAQLEELKILEEYEVAMAPPGLGLTMNRMKSSL